MQDERCPVSPPSNHLRRQEIPIRRRRHVRAGDESIEGIYVLLELPDNDEGPVTAEVSAIVLQTR